MNKTLVRNLCFILAGVMLIFAALVYTNVIPLENRGSLTLEVNGQTTELSFIAATPYPEFWELYFTDNNTYTVALYVPKDAANGSVYTFADTTSAGSGKADFMYFAIGGDTYYTGPDEDAGLTDLNITLDKFGGRGRPASGSFTATLKDKDGTKLSGNFAVTIKLFPQAPLTPEQAASQAAQKEQK